jgi:hypothetical protein
MVWVKVKGHTIWPGTVSKNYFRCQKFVDIRNSTARGK